MHQGNSSRGGKHWSDSGYILQLELIRLSDGFTTGGGSKRKRETKEDSRIYWPEPMDGWSCHLLRWKRLGAGFSRVGRNSVSTSYICDPC